MINLRQLDLSKLDIKNTYLVAVSGGADSMALLDMLRKEGYKLIVAHVNYKKRDSSDRDENIVKDYCIKHSIPFFVNRPIQNKKGNFENWAREVRYEFFKEVYDRENCSCLLLAHHRDDVIETYIMKQRRKSFGESLTIPISSISFGMNVYRPSYFMSKKSLYEYCKQNEIKYGEDETNFQPIYTRNKIRLNELSKLSEIEKEELFLKISKDNDLWTKKLEGILKEYKGNKELNFSKFSSENLDSKILILYHYIVSNIESRELARSLSRKRLVDIISKFENTPNIQVEMIDDLYLVREYEKISIKKIMDVDYLYTLERFDFLKTPYFEITLDGKNMEGIHVYEDDYPLYIRPYKKGDKIKIKGGHKLVSRLYIDKKMPKELRKRLPLLFNRKNEIILIPSLYKDLERKTLQSNLFMIKYHKY